MKTLSDRLAARLESDGWDVVQNHARDLEWWADEIWQLKSRRSPQGASAFITFLVDPQWDGVRRKGQGVWAVSCSAELPLSRADAERGGILRLKAAQQEIEKFVEIVRAVAYR